MKFCQKVDAYSSDYQFLKHGYVYEGKGGLPHSAQPLVADQGVTFKLAFVPRKNALVDVALGVTTLNLCELDAEQAYAKLKKKSWVVSLPAFYSPCPKRTFQETTEGKGNEYTIECKSDGTLLLHFYNKGAGFSREAHVVARGLPINSKPLYLFFQTLTHWFFYDYRIEFLTQDSDQHRNAILMNPPPLLHKHLPPPLAACSEGEFFNEALKLFGSSKKQLAKEDAQISEFFSQEAIQVYTICGVKHSSFKKMLRKVSDRSQLVNHLFHFLNVFFRMSELDFTRVNFATEDELPAHNESYEEKLRRLKTFNDLLSDKLNTANDLYVAYFRKSLLNLKPWNTPLQLLAKAQRLGLEKEDVYLVLLEAKETTTKIATRTFLACVLQKKVSEKVANLILFMQDMTNIYAYLSHCHEPTCSNKGICDFCCEYAAFNVTASRWLRNIVLFPQLGVQ